MFVYLRVEPAFILVLVDQRHNCLSQVTQLLDQV